MKRACSAAVATGRPSLSTASKVCSRICLSESDHELLRSVGNPRSTRATALAAHVNELGSPGILDTESIARPQYTWVV